MSNQVIRNHKKSYYDFYIPKYLKVIVITKESYKVIKNEYNCKKSETLDILSLWSRWVVQLRKHAFYPRMHSCHLYVVQTKKIPQINDLREKVGISNQSRTGVDGMRTRCPRPLDDGDSICNRRYFTSLFMICKSIRRFCQFALSERAVSAIFFAASSGVIVPANRFCVVFECSTPKRAGRN